MGAELQELGRVKEKIRRIHETGEFYAFVWSGQDLFEHCDTAAFFDARSDTYEREHDSSTGYQQYFDKIDALIVEDFKGRFPRGELIRLLDVGCGPGEKVRRTIEKIGPDYTISLKACDFSPKMAEIAKKTLGIEVEEFDATDLKYPDKTFDCVFITYGVLGCLNLPGIRTALSNAHKVLGSNKPIYIDDFSTYQKGEFFPPRESGHKHMYYGRGDLPGVMGYHYFFDGDEMDGLLEEAGFEVLNSSYVPFHDTYNLFRIAKSRLL